MRLTITPLFRASILALFLMSAAQLLAQPASFYRIYFDYAKHSLTDKARAVIDAEVAKLDLSQRYRISLIGHTDRRGNLGYNQELSNRRALSVKEALTAYGFNEQDIKVEGLAYLDPLSQDTSEAAMARNRRVEVIVEQADWNVESTYMLVPSTQPSELTYERSGTKIKIPANAFTYQDGTPVEGEVLVQYREFRDPADFIVSRIPMQLEHDGVPGYFNSTGMFEVRAYDQAGTSLQLQDDKELSLDFVQTQLAEGTQFWQYDEENKSWKTGEEAVSYEAEGTRQISLGGVTDSIGALPLDWPNRAYWDKYPDTFAQLQLAYEFLPSLLDVYEDTEIDAREPYDLRTFDERFHNGVEDRNKYAGIHYIGHREIRKIYRKPKYYNLRLRSTWSYKGKGFFRMEDKTGENEELTAFEGYMWKIRKRDSKKARSQTRGLRFCDVRVKQKDRGENRFVIEIKYNGLIHKLHASLGTREEGRINHGTADSLYQVYLGKLSARRLAFDQPLIEKAKVIELVWPCVKLLLPKSVSNDSLKSAGLRRALWEERYSKNKWPSEFNSREANEQHLWRYQGVRGFDFLSWAGRNFKEELTSLQQPNWRQLIEDYKEELAVTEEKFLTIQKAFDEATPRLRIGGLGIFNCDVLYRYEEKHELMAQFRDQKGNPLEAERIEIINHDLNGLLAYINDSRIHLDLSAPNTMLVYTKDGRLWYASRSMLSSISLKDKDSYTFELKDVGDYLGDPEVLRKLFSDS